MKNKILICICLTGIVPLPLLADLTDVSPSVSVPTRKEKVGKKKSAVGRKQTEPPVAKSPSGDSSVAPPSTDGGGKQPVVSDSGSVTNREKDSVSPEDQSRQQNGTETSRLQQQTSSAVPGDGEQERAAKKLPVHFEGDELSGMRQQGVIELHSNVRVRQADLYMQSDRARVFFDEHNDVDKVEAIGRVRMSKKDAKTGDMIRAQSERADFDAGSQRVTLNGKAVLFRGRDTIRGDVIDYDLQSGWLKASKVKGVVQPEQP